jgi:hypothetical protein
MTTSEASDDPFEIHSRREPLPNAGIRVILLSELSNDSAAAIIAPLINHIQAIGRQVERSIEPVDGSDLRRSLICGLEGATLPLVLVTTALEPWTSAHLDPLLEAIDQADHVVGRRRAAKAENAQRWLGALPRRLLFALPLLDVNSPCRLHRLDKLLEIPLQSTSSFLDTEILAKATFFGHLIAEVNVPSLRGFTTTRGKWSDWSHVLRNPQFRRASGPAEESQCQHEGADGPCGEDQQG